MIKLGETVTDTITGFSGTVIGRVEYLTGCIQFEVQSKELKDGVPVRAQWIDEGRLESSQPTSAGGPHDIPPNLTPPS